MVRWNDSDLSDYDKHLNGSAGIFRIRSLSILHRAINVTLPPHVLFQKKWDRRRKNKMLTSILKNSELSSLL